MKSILISLLLCLCFIFGMACKDCVDVDVPYTEEEPYEAIEAVEETLTYVVGESTWYREDGATLLGIKPKLIASAIITNTGKEGGVFEINGNFKTTLEDEIVLRDSKYIASGASEKFEFEEELDDYVQVKPDGINVIPPIVKIERLVTKYKTITKYRKCNTCVEDCGEYYKKEESKWWIWVIIGLMVVGVLFKGKD